MQICGFKHGRVTLPAENHKSEKAAHLAESFYMVRQRWLHFQKTEEESTPSPGERRRSDELIGRSPAAGGCAPDRIRSVGSSESDVHLLSVNRDSLGEGIIQYVYLLSDLKGVTLRKSPWAKSLAGKPYYQRPGSKNTRA